MAQQLKGMSVTRLKEIHVRGCLAAVALWLLTTASAQTTGTLITIGSPPNTCRVPFGEPCPDGRPGVRCGGGDPCQDAVCPSTPNALCGAFFCQRKVLYRGQLIGDVCQANFFSPSSCDFIANCTDIAAATGGPSDGAASSEAVTEEPGPSATIGDGTPPAVAPVPGPADDVGDAVQTEGTEPAAAPSDSPSSGAAADATMPATAAPTPAAQQTQRTASYSAVALAMCAALAVAYRR